MKHCTRFITILLVLSVVSSVFATEKMSARAALFVRDPFIVPVAETQTYYLYASGRIDATGRRGVVVYKSKDLENWSDPTPVFGVPDNYWADAKGSVWAPEVHRYDGKYYLFVTLADPAKKFAPVTGRPPLHLRGTSICVAESPDGPFRPTSQQPHTPADWMSLDGTLWVEDGKPWMVFCHEWFQTIDGTFELVPLKSDLSGPAAAPVTLFTASEIPWSFDMKASGIVIKGRPVSGYVSDGCFLFRTHAGRLLMLQSSFIANQTYALGISYSESGKIAGPWKHEPKPLYAEDGGHGMIFTTFDGRLMLSLHSPNSEARCRLIELEDIGHTLQIKKER